MSALSFAGQVAIVSGGGRNLGRAYCLELARRGAAVVVSDLAPPEERGSSVADAVVAEIVAAGGRAEACYESVATPEGAEAIVSVGLERLGGVDAVVNNAGIMRNGYLEALPADALDLVLEVNVRGSFLLTKAAWPHMRAKGYGRVVMVSSGGGMFGSPGISPYAAAKAGIYGLAHALSLEGEPHGIRVNTVLPLGGSMFSKDVPPPAQRERSTAELRELLAPRRLNEAVAALVAVLASRECPVSGEAYSAGYGRYARVFVGLAPGWAAPDAATVSAEQVFEHLEQIRDPAGFSVPRHLYDELATIAETLGVRPAPPAGEEPAV